MKKIFLCILAIATIVSCNKDKAPDNPIDSDKMSLSLNIQNGAISSKSSMGGSVPSNSITKLLPGGKIFFFDQNGILTFIYTLTQADIDASTAGTNGAMTIQNIPDISTQVGMIANIPTDLVLNVTDIPSFQSCTMGILAQSNMANGAASGNSDHNAVQGIALVDNAGTGTTLNPIIKYTAPDPSGATHYAAISLTPAVARIEIAPNAIEIGAPAAGGTELVTSFNFGGFYLNNFYLNMQLNKVASNVFGQTMNWATSSQPLYNVIANVANHFDLVSLGTTIPVTVGGTTSNTGVAYHVFPTNNLPHIIIAGSNFNYGQGIVEPNTLYWVITDYYIAGTTKKLTSLEAGNVYKITSIAVGGTTYPRVEPYDDPIKLKIEVTVTPWSVINIDVNPK